MTSLELYQPEVTPPAFSIARYQQAQSARRNWENLWQECSDYTLPYTNTSYGGLQKNSKLFDGTAADAIDQLASSLLAQLTPPFSSWIGVVSGPMATPKQIEVLTPLLRETNEILQGHFDRSNFSVEMHQAFLDLVTYGTACLRFDETAPGELSAFHFNTTPLINIHFLDSARGQLDTSFCTLSFTAEELIARFPHAAQLIEHDKKETHDVLYIATPLPQGGYTLSCILDPNGSSATTLEELHSDTSPFIAFRWQKSAGELYGRSPIMKALPDIKTANKVVELILKNASIAVTGIWLADDDGILNPANIKLVPGAIIPKAVGSAGLTPLKMPGNFDISQLVLSDLRKNIKHALLGDYLTTMNDKRMTATEVLERQSNLIQMLGATFGRLQGELLTPLALRALSILKQRGEIPDLYVDGRIISLEYRSPLARAQGQRDVQATLSWIQTAREYGDEATQFLNIPATLQFLAKSLGVPSHLINTPPATE